MSDLITLEDPVIDDMAFAVVDGSPASQRAFGEMAKLVAAGKMSSAFPIMGGAPNPVHPFAAPTVSGTTMTVEMYLNQPTRVTRMIQDLTLQRFMADRVFASAGGVTGGAVVYDEATENELYTEDDVERVAPGGEFPIVGSELSTPKIAEVEKWGGKVFILDETRDRNNSTTFANKMRQLANTQVRKINQRAIEVLNASITASSQTFTGRNWTTVVTGGSSQSVANLWPLRDFALAVEMAEVDELGVVYDLVIMNPQEYTSLILIYGADGLPDVLKAMGLSIYVTNRQPAGKVKYVSERQVGEMRVEKPLGTETWRDPDHERTFVQSSVRPVMYVTNPFAVLESTGHAG